MLKKAFNFYFHIYIRLKFLKGAQVHVVDPNK